MINLKKKAFFFDRDGVINYDKGHITKKKNIILKQDIQKGLLYIKKKKFLIFLVTNQSAIGRKLITEKDLINLHNYLEKKIEKYKKIFDDIEYCPHHPTKGIGEYKIKCECRKPGNLMIEKLIYKYNIDRYKSFMIGDKLSDYKTAKKSYIKFFWSKNYSLYKQLIKII